MLQFRSGWQHCPFCGAPLDGPPPTRCARCGKHLYFNSNPCVGVVVVRDGAVLAIRRARDPWRGYWDLPGGFCDSGEHPEATAVREAREETGLEVELLGLSGIYMDTYPYQGETLPILNLFFAARIPAGAQPRLVEDEASDVGWLPLIDHPPLAFAHQEQALTDAVRRYFSADG